MKQKTKTIMFAGSMCGSQYKSTTIAILGDCLEALGNTVKYINLDATPNSTLQFLQIQAESYDPGSLSCMYNAFCDANNCYEDIVIIDCPVDGCMQDLIEFSTIEQSDDYTRILFVPIVNSQDQKSLEGAMEFVSLFSALPHQLVILANNWDQKHNILSDTSMGKLLCLMAQGKLIKFPAFSNRMRKESVEQSAFMTKANRFADVVWESYHKQCLESICPHTKWLTGKPLPSEAPNPASLPIISNPNCALEMAMAEASRNYLRTGEIHDTLLQCYNQNGKWLEDTAASQFVDDASQKRLSKITIPESRRCIINANGEHILLTSYSLHEEPDDERPYWEYLEEEDLSEKVDKTLILPWHEIRGMCEIAIHRHLYCPNLRRFNAHYNNTDVTALSIRLPELIQCTDLTLRAEYFYIPKLAQAGHLKFSTARHIEAPSLRAIDNLHLGSAFTVHFPMLKQVKECLVGDDVQEFAAPVLETVNRRKSGRTGLILTNAWNIEAPHLQYVGRLLDTSSAESFCPHGLVVDGRWETHTKTKTQ